MNFTATVKSINPFRIRSAPGPSRHEREPKGRSMGDALRAGPLNLLACERG